MRTAANLLLIGIFLGLGAFAPVARARAQGSESPLPSGRLVFGAFQAEFSPDGTFTIESDAGWPPFAGTWTVDRGELVLTANTGGDVPEGEVPEGCGAPGRYRFTSDGGGLSLRLAADDCRPRGMVLGASDWRPAGEPESVPERRIRLTPGEPFRELPEAGTAEGSWPSFRGTGASGVADGMNLPDEWDAESGRHVLWRTRIPGLAHSSPIVWGDRIFVTSAVSSEGEASFRPGLYGDGDAAQDRSVHRFELTALDKHSGKILWTEVAVETEPIDKRHIKSTYANATPATDGRLVVASFGSQGVFAFDVEGRRLWSVDLGRLNLGAYDVPSYEWGPASSPVLWNGLVILQCDTQTDSFLLALDAVSGEIMWKTDRDELPTWGTPSVFETESGPELVTNGARFVRGYDPRNGKELWRLGRSSKITAPTPIMGDGLIVVSSGRGPERPIFVLKPGARGDITLPKGETSNQSIVWSIERRGPYMPTPLIYDGRLYVLGNNGVFDVYELRSGAEVYRQRLPHRGSGFSASPVASDGKIYLPSEDGDILVVEAGPTFEHLATNPMGELLMATPALSEGVLYIRGAHTLFAIGKK